MTNFSTRLKEFRHKQRLTQTELAEMLGCSRNYVSMLEGGRPIDEESSIVKLFEGYERGHFASGPRGRLKAAREAAGKTQAEVAKEIGYQIGVYQALEDGSSRISEKMAERLCSAIPGLTKEDLLDGSDYPPTLGDEVAAFGSKPKVQTPPGMSARYVPLISWAQAGTMTDFSDEAYGHEGALAFDSKDPKAFAVKLRGDSMSPVYGEGDVVILYPSHPPKNGDLVIARLVERKGSDVMFKIYNAPSEENITLTSYNPAFPPLTYSRQDFEWIYPAGSITKFVKH